jgi:phage gpG-like protein
MKIDIKLDGLQNTLDALERAGLAAEYTVEDVVEDLAYETQGLAVRGIQRGGGGGRVYEKYSPRRTHTASAPGKYPNTDTGRLASSVAVLFDIAKRGKEAIVGTSLEYGAHLEFGTSRMAARPWLLPSFEKARASVNRRFKGGFEGRL